MTSYTNFFLQSKYLYEKVDRRKGLTNLNNELATKLGQVAFFDFAESIFIGHYLSHYFEDFESAISYHLYHPDDYGATDLLNVRYGLVFKELWQMLPCENLLISLLNKDYRAVPVDLLYTEIGDNDFKDMESVNLVWETLVEAAQQGWLLFDDNDYKDLSARFFWEKEMIESKDSVPLLGLKEKILTELPEISYQSSYKNPETFWEKEYQNDPSRVLSYAIYYIFGNFQQGAGMLSNKWKALQKNAPPLSTYFHQGFKAMTLAEQTNVMHYAGFNAKEPEKWIENFLKVLQNKRSMLDFVEEFKDVESQLN